MDPEDSISSDEPSSPARNSDNSSSDANVVSSGDEASVAARDSSDDSSDLNIVGSTGSAPSSNATKDSGDRQSYVPAGEASSSIAKDSSDTSSDANNVVATSGEPSSSNANAVASSRAEPSSSASMGPASSGRSVDVASGYTCDELVFKALYTINDNHDGNGLDINGIYEYNRERPGLPENFMDLLKDELRKLVFEGQIEKVGNLYKIPTGAISPESSKPKESMDAESSEKLEEQASTSGDDHSMSQELPSTPIDENQEKVNEAMRLVAEAEVCEIQAKEAAEQADRCVKVLHETRRDMLLAEEIARGCAKGEKIFLR